MERSHSDPKVQHFSLLGMQFSASEQVTTVMRNTLQVFAPAMTGTALGWPLWRLQTMVQSPMPEHPKTNVFQHLVGEFQSGLNRKLLSPKTWFQDLHNALFGKVLILPFQMLPAQLIATVTPEEEQPFVMKLAVRGLSGAASGTPFNHLERCTLESATHGASFYQTTLKIWTQHGLKGLLHGALTTSIRESKFCISAFPLQALFTQLLTPHLPSDFSAKLAAAYVSGIISIGLTQPWDSALRKMHNAPMRYTTLCALKAVFQEKGIQGLYAGGLIKSFRLAILFYCIAAGNRYLKKDAETGADSVEKYFPAKNGKKTFTFYPATIHKRNESHGSTPVSDR